MVVPHGVAAQQEHQRRGCAKHLPFHRHKLHGPADSHKAGILKKNRRLLGFSGCPKHGAFCFRGFSPKVENHISVQGAATADSEAIGEAVADATTGALSTWEDASIVFGATDE
jgi:hypothetical protein